MCQDTMFKPYTTFVQRVPAKMICICFVSMRDLEWVGFFLNTFSEVFYLYKGGSCTLFFFFCKENSKDCHCLACLYFGNVSKNYA